MNAARLAPCSLTHYFTLGAAEPLAAAGVIGAAEPLGAAGAIGCGVPASTGEFG